MDNEEYPHDDAVKSIHIDPSIESHVMSSRSVDSAAYGSQVDPNRRKSGPHSVVVEEDKGPNEAVLDVIDEARVVYSTMQGVQLVEQPAILKAELHEHQIEGISWMVHMFQSGVPMILGDQMGLGKTLQSIGFLAYLHNRLHKKGPYLIVVPLSVLSNWLAEIERFCPSFRAVRFHGKYFLLSTHCPRGGDDDE